MQIEKVMKALFVRKLYLWPRFEAHVKDALNDLPIEARGDTPVHLTQVISTLPCPCPPAMSDASRMLSMPIILDNPPIDRGYKLCLYDRRGCWGDCATAAVSEGEALKLSSDTQYLACQENAFDTCDVQVVELAQEMTPAMITIYGRHRGSHGCLHQGAEAGQQD